MLLITGISIVYEPRREMAARRGVTGGGRARGVGGGRGARLAARVHRPDSQQFARARHLLLLKK